MAGWSQSESNLKMAARPPGLIKLDCTAIDWADRRQARQVTGGHEHGSRSIDLLV